MSEDKKSQTQGWIRVIETLGMAGVDSNTQWELGMQVLDRAFTRGGKPYGITTEKGVAARYVLDNAYELPETPSGVRPVARKREGGGYDIEYEAYCVYCGEVWPGDEYSSWVDIESAEMVFTEAIGYGFQRLDDGRVVCDVDEKRSGCWKWCKCPECEGEDKIIGLDQQDCQSKPWTRDEMEARFG